MYLRLTLSKYLILAAVSLIFTLSPSIASAQQSLQIYTSKRFIAKICNQILSEALTAINYKMIPVYLPSNRSAAMANKGVTDGTACRIGGFENKFKNMMRTGPSITTLYSHVFTTQLELPISEGDWHSLRPYHVGIFNGHYYAAKGTKNFENVTAFDTNQQMFKMLELGRIDAAIMLTVDGVESLKANNLTQKIKISQRPLSKLPLYFFMHKKNAHIRDTISDAISAIVSSGRAQEITDQLHREAFAGIPVNLD